MMTCQMSQKADHGFAGKPVSVPDWCSGEGKASGFFSLPIEIRLRIYEYLFQDAEAVYQMDCQSDEDSVQFNAATSSPNRNILATSKACRIEALRVYHRALAMRLVRGEWRLVNMEDYLPPSIMNNLAVLRMDTVGGVTIEDVLLARAVFQNLRLIQVSTFHEVIWGSDPFDDVDLWDMLDVQSFLDRVLPGFQIGKTIGGVRVQGAINLHSTCITCDDCDGCENDYEVRLALSIVKTKSLTHLSAASLLITVPGPSSVVETLTMSAFLYISFRLKFLGEYQTPR
jgi:hypothetical protein